VPPAGFVDGIVVVVVPVVNESKFHPAAVLPQVVLGREQGEQESGPSPPALKDDPEVQAAGTPPAVME